MNTYVTFGQVHRHEIGDKVFDKDCVAVIKSESREDGREKTLALFGRKFSVDYFEKEWERDGETEEERMQYFPRGYIEVIA